MKRLNVTAAILCAALLSGCSHSVPRVSWYKRHPAALKTAIARCNNNPGELQSSPTCINAAAAQGDLEMKRLMSGMSKERPAPAPSTTTTQGAQGVPLPTLGG